MKRFRSTPSSTPMICRLRPAALAIIVVVGAACVPVRTSSAPPTAETVLRMFVRAQRGVNMRGQVVVFQPADQGVKVTTRRVVRTATGQSLAVWQEPAAERGTVIQSDDTWTSRYVPSENLVRVKRSLRADASADGVSRQVRLLQRNYDVMLEPAETVAGRRCSRLLLRSLHGNRSTVRLWLDVATGAELRRDEADEGGNTTCITMFTSVEFPAAIPSSAARVRIPSAARRLNISRSPVFTNAASLRAAAQFPVRLPLSMPAGYVFEQGTLVEISGQRTAFLRYTDGLGDVTILESRPRPNTPPGYRACYVRTRPSGDTEVDCLYEDMSVLLVGRGTEQSLVAMAQALDSGRERAWLARTSRAFGVPQSVVTGMRNHGVGADSIVALLDISARSGQPWPSLYEQHEDGWAWQDIARRHRVPEAAVARRISDIVGR